MTFGKTFLACLLAIVVGSVLSFVVSIILFIGAVSSFALFSEQKTIVESGSILVIDLSEPLVESPSGSLASQLDWSTMSFTHHTTLYNAVAMIDAAASDPRIKGVYIKSGPQTAPSLEHLYELRTALQRFRATGGDKFILAYGDLYSQGALYLASAADEVYVNPAGGVDWSGLSLGTMFFKGTLDKLGVTAEVVRHGSFKSAVEPFLRSEMSPENREQYTALTGSVWGYITAEIAAARGLTVDSLQSWASQLAIVTADDAVRSGLVDTAIYRDRMIEKLCRLTGVEGEDDLRLLDFHTYLRSGVHLYGNAVSPDQVAVIYAEGDIVDAGSSDDAVVGNDLAYTLRAARADNAVKAVVLRVNSPGGSALASEVIRHEMEQLRAEKPVVVSMGGYAASGGYWISASADKIVTAPMTLTGSIGVFGVMFNAQEGLRDKLGVTYDAVQTNPSAGMGTIFRPLSKVERLMLQRSVDTVYNRFIVLVAAGRDLPVATVDSLGGGRVWSGAQAVDNGLANSIGGLNDAIVAAGEMAGLDSYAIVRMDNRNTSPLAQLLGDLSGAVWAKVSGSPTAIDVAKQQIERLGSYHKQVVAGVEALPTWNN